MPKGDGKVPFLQKMNPDYPWFRKGDVESLPMLFLDNLSTLVGVIGAMSGAIPAIWGNAIPDEFKAAYVKMVYEKVCPGVGFSLVFGNLWYGWMARKLAGYEERTDVTAIPYGINTPVGFAVAFGIFLPLGFKFAFEDGMTADKFADKIWHAAAMGCFVSGLLEMLGAFTGNFVRKNLSKAAIYAPIASVGWVWLAMSPLTKFGKEPIIAILPLGIVFLGFFANEGKGVYGKVPAAILVIVIGIIFKWAGFGKYNDDASIMWENVQAADEYIGKIGTIPFVMFQGLPDIGIIMPILAPFALQSFIETMELVEAACAVGDHYPMMEAMLVDGMGTSFGALWGSVLPTTAYIGHTRHKQVNAGCGYSIANGLIYFVVMLTGLFPCIFALVDDVSIGCILIAVGLLISQQAFQYTVPRHYPALAVGIMFVIYDYCRLDSSDTRVEIINLAAGGGILCSFIVTQIIADLIDVRLERALIYTSVACLFSVIGIMHGNNPVGPEWLTEDKNDLAELTLAIKEDPSAAFPQGNEGFRFAIGYGMLAVFIAIHIGLQKAKLIPEAVMTDGSPEGELTKEVKEVAEVTA